ncbi:prolipoprotein diacylglyceryl transferase [Nocardia australiensis]|uniref:prolipoprotein diacylglyceryl transferase n=1 Tax=Nocardia australiensis TaxID=2887191 RepID=UPI001D15701E|nr:prolipoprotein diacylglyceryl transferase family protein [Nocardia australiensis]
MVPNLVFGIPTHGFFVAVGVAVAAIVFVLECRRRGALGEESLVAVTGALVGGAIGMRLSGIAETLDPLESWMFGARSVLGGLFGAYAGVLIAKRIIGYTQRTGDLFAPAVALGMAVGRIGCHLTEAPGRPTELPWGVHAPATVPSCPGCVSGVAMHPSFLYEIAFQLAAFAALVWARGRVSAPGELFTLYVSAYAVFRFLVEFTRANDTVWLNLTRPQWFLLPGLVLVVIRLTAGYRRGHYDVVLRRKVAA